jgi:hypothetical protein
MAATELSSPRAAATRARRGVRRGGWLCSYLLVWGLTLLAGLVVLCAGRRLMSLTRSVLGLELSARHNPPPTLGHVLALAAHNLPIVAWPILIGLTGVEEHPFGRRVADTAVVMWLIANTAPVGAALAAYGAPLLAYLPQLPFEWAALAVGTAAWITQRRGPATSAERVRWLAVAAALVLCGAVLETAAVPHM